MLNLPFLLIGAAALALTSWLVSKANEPGPPADDDDELTKRIDRRVKVLESARRARIAAAAREARMIEEADRLMADQEADALAADEAGEVPE